MPEVDAEIDRLSERRAEIWRGSESAAGEVVGIEKKLAALYEERRFSRAQSPRDEVMRRARAAQEIEKLQR